MDIQTVSTRYANRTLRVKSLNLEELDATVDTWLLDLLRAIAKKSLLEPIQNNELVSVLKGFELLSSNECWRSLIRQRPSEIQVDELLLAYRQLEDAIVDLDLSNNSSRQIFDGVRRHVKRYLQRRGDCPQVTLLRSFYAHRKFSFSKSRRLISDEKLYPPGKDREPIGAIQHSNFKELKLKVEKRLDQDLRKIQDACTKEIEEQLGLFDWLAKIMSEPRNGELAKTWDELVGRHSDVWRRAMHQFTERDLLREFLLRHAIAPGFRPSLFAAYVDQKRILEYATLATQGLSPKRLSSLIRLPHLLSANTLTHFLILLQIHTGWNVSSILELTTDDVEQDADGFLIKGFKSKTNSQTPPVWVLSRDGMVFICIKMLLARISYLRRSGRVALTEKRLWIASRRSNDLNTRLSSGLAAGREKLIKKYGLPGFSFEQIRVQCLARISLDKGGLEAARRIAGHASIRTTAYYLDQLLLNRLNAATNLEFQRRLERNVRFRVSEESIDGSLTAAEDMLYPVGDGTSCSQPTKPPVSSWLQDGICKAEKCHSGSGCPHSKLILDPCRIEEIALTARFYEDNWRRLASKNADAFREKHLPAMLFNMALHGFVSKGPYGHVLRRLDASARHE